ncbi:unnamed protein product [Closterium sp. Yama58-4]|nr:unnamed protein product [Closterium sp. Yama58-4]
MMAYTILLRNITPTHLGGFWHSHTIPEAERTRASAAAEITSAAAEITSAAADITSAAAEITSAAAETTSAAAETTSAAAETTSAAAETTSAAAETTTAAAETSTPVAGPSTAPLFINDTSPIPAQQLKPAPREVHRSANVTAGFYSNSDLSAR